MIVGHSLGGNYGYLFVRRQQQAWKDKYIQSLVTIAAPLGGAGAALHTLAAGNDKDAAYLEKHASRTLSRTHPVYVYLLPTANAFGSLPVVQMYDGRNFTAAEMPEILRVIGDSEGGAMLPPIKKARNSAPPTGVEVHCLRGTGIPTVSGIRYRSQRDFPFHPEKLWGLGDEQVNQESADVCLQWARGAGQKARLHAAAFPGVDHSDIVKNSRVVRYITDLIQRSWRRHDATVSGQKD